MSNPAEEARRRIARRAILEKMMEAAFDNELDDLIAGFEKAMVNDCPVPINPKERADVTLAASDREDSLLGEAACGNAVDVMKYLISKGADVSYKGKYNRTPLQRALNNEALDAVRLLLQCGADPRLLVPQDREEPSEEYPQGRILFHDWDPKEVDGLQCGPAAKKVLKEWDINVTLKLLRDRDAADAAAKSAETERKTAAAESTASTLEAVKAEYDACVLALGDAIRKREQRILEYDTMKCEGKSDEQLLVVDGMIKQAIEEVKQLNVKTAELQAKLKVAKKQAREAANAAGGVDVDSKYTMTIGLNLLEDVIIHDHDEALKANGKVCLIIDRSRNALTFLSYRAVGIIDVGNSHHMYPEQLRLGLIGALRYGKPLIVNLRDRDLAEAFVFIRDKFNAVHPDLFEHLLRGRITDPQVYVPLITDAVLEQHPEFHKTKFRAGDTQRFRFAVLTHEESPQDWEVVGQFCSVLVE